MNHKDLTTKHAKRVDGLSLLDRDRDSQGIRPLQQDAREGGAVAGSTRREIEKRSGKPVVTSDNFKRLTDNTKNNIVGAGLKPARLTGP